MKPTTNRLLVRVIPEEAPKEGEAVPVKGTAVITGEVLEHGPTTQFIKKGNKVVFAPFGFDEITIAGEKLMIVSEELIIAYE